MDVIASPTTVNFTTQFGAPAPALTPGEVVEAQVLQLLADGRARLAVAGSVLDVITTVPLTPGTTVRLAVKNTPEGIRFTLIDGAGGRSAVIPATDPTRANPATMLSGAAAPSANAAPPTSATIVSAGTSGTPAGAAVAGNASAAATLVDTATAPLAPTSPVAPAPSPEAASAAALAGAVRGAAVRQNSLAPLFADLAVAVSSPALPQAVRQAAEQVLNLRVSAKDGLAPENFAQAVRRSGLFLESNLASGAPVTPADDLKAALTVLRQVLKAWLAADPSGKAGNLAPELRTAPPLVPSAAPVPAGTAVPTGESAALAAAHAARVNLALDHALPAAPTASAPPPYRGAPTSAQPEAVPSVTPATDAEEIGHVLMRDTDGAIARQTLLQAASLPDRVDHGDGSGPRWHFEIPFATPQGTTLAQFEVSRDGRSAPREGAKAVWRARFSIDVEPIGPVHGQVALIGERAAVTLWAERPDGAARLRDNAGMLSDALRKAELEPDVLVRAGAPPRPRETTAPAGRFLDRAT